MENLNEFPINNVLNLFADFIITMYKDLDSQLIELLFKKDYTS